MAQLSTFEDLKPVSGKHSIQEAILTVHLSPATPIPSPETFAELRKGRFGSQFPKCDIVTLTDGRLATNLSENTGRFELGPPRPIGFSFESYRTDGTLRYRLRGENQTPRSWIAANFLEYDNWESVRTRAKGWLKKLVAKCGGLDVVGLGVHFVDILLWDSRESPPRNLVFQVPNEFLPGRLSNAEVSGWKSSFTYSYENESAKRIEKFDISEQVNRTTGFRRFSINMPLVAELRQPVRFKRLLDDSGPTGFNAVMNAMHDDNKNYLKKILSPHVTKMIGLTNEG